MEAPEDEKSARKAARKAAKRAARAAAAQAPPGEGASAPAAEAADAPPDEAATAPAAPASKKRARAAEAAPVLSSSSSAASLSAAAALFRTDRRIAVQDADGGAWPPVATFAELAPLCGPEFRAVTASFKEPTPIQAQSWPVLFGGRDLIGIAATGSGKTLAFALPGFSRILTAAATSGAKKGPAAPAGAGSGGVAMLVLAPTRELAMQTAVVAEAVGASAHIRAVCIYGGVPKGPQVEALRGRDPAQVVVATPGRLLDLVQDGVCSLAKVTYLVLDEADRMLDMGFERDIRSIIAMLPKAGPEGGRQTAMFSATWPVAIQKIAEEHLHRAVKVVIGSAELSATRTVKQIVEVLEQPAKDGALLRLLNLYHASRKNRVIVFCLHKKEASRVESNLRARGWTCGAIHGDMTQDARTRAFNAFRDGLVPLLIATDVAARGLDIPQVEYVINLTFPLTIEDYVHRIGRTGRAGAQGTAHTFFTPADKGHAGELVNVLREAGAEVPEALLKFGTHVKKKEHALYGAHFKAEADAGPPKAATKMRFDD